MEYISEEKFLNPDLGLKEWMLVSTIVEQKIEL
jgi:hypothetical protein